MSAEAAVLPDSATVWTTPEGAPARLVWGHRRFIVTDRPIPWIDRTPWWESLSRMPAGKADMQEQQMWQVQATAEDGQILIFDLAVMPGQQWPVTGIYD
ncbi:DUF6504 family protein [Nesterenkonia massiliensis]|uniref:DUF6504 domain-containing protein n=2 Tax=Nesterenkonia TaxID=57494 RepID=A0ABP9G4V7_9MICC|nr:DUF6504 family protein [Nesterenkonia massiliensis]MCT1606192.1 DUF6504 family protein [Nesterenkonia massiliensis]